MKNFITKFVREEKGQGMTEYGLILGLIALAAVVALGAFGDEIGARFDEIKNTLIDSGETDAGTDSSGTNL
jgi:pilus assembly protein Flp/PilA